MKIFKKKTLLILGVMLIVIIGAVSSVSASSTWQTLQAYRGVKIFYNGVEMTDSSQSYIINNTTYVPLRMIMEKMGSNVVWDSNNYWVLLTDNSAALEASIEEKDDEIASLESTIAKLERKVSSLEDTIDDLEDELDENDISTSDIRDTLYYYYEDAGDDYFDDRGIEVSISVSGDEDDLAYTIKFDFDDADEYEDLTELDENDIESFLDDVEDTIYDEIDNTDFEDADITGRLVDKNDSDYYVQYNGRYYITSW